MNNYNNHEIELLQRRICPDCREFSIYKEGDTWYCEGAGGLGVGGDDACLWCMRDIRYRELTSVNDSAKPRKVL